MNEGSTVECCDLNISSGFGRVCITAIIIV